MIDLIKKIMFTGVGLASVTKDKLEEVGKDIIEKGKLSEKEGKEFLSELKKKSEESKKEMEAKTERIVQESLKKMNLATRDDLMKLEEKLNELSAILAAKEKEE